MFRFLDTYFDRFRPIAKYFEISWNVPKHFETFRHISKYFELFRNMSRYFEIARNISKYFEILRNCSTFLEMFRNSSNWFVFFMNLDYISEKPHKKAKQKNNCWSCRSSLGSWWRGKGIPSPPCLNRNGYSGWFKLVFSLSLNGYGV